MATSLVYDQRPDPVVRGLVTVGALMRLFLEPVSASGARSGSPATDLQGGAALGRLLIFALGVAPVIAALAIAELLRLLVPPFGRWAATHDEPPDWTLSRAPSPWPWPQSKPMARELIERIAGVPEDPGMDVSGRDRRDRDRRDRAPHVAWRSRHPLRISATVC